MLPPQLRGAIIALGNFDGFHLGHQAVVGRAVQMARDRGVAAIVATFDPHPVHHFTPLAAPFRLTTLDQRQRMFASAGVDAMMVFHFNGTLANVTPEDFVQRWLAGAGGVVTGRGFSFGRKRAGTPEVLAELARRNEMAYEAVTTVGLGTDVISSSRIRRALGEGDCETAQMLLTRPFAICGDLQYHAARGPQASCGDAIIRLGSYVRPLAGTYAVTLRVPDGLSRRCVAHFGWPCIEGSANGVLRLEMPGLLEGMPGRSVEIDLVSRLRKEAGK